MTTIPLSKSETTLLVEAASRDGLLVIPATTKPSTAQRLLGKLLSEKLVIATEQDGEARHHLTPAGYRAVGLKPKRARAAAAAAAAAPESPAVPSPSGAPGKKELVLELLRRGEGASLAELIAATGWLPHTTRAVLSRLRSAGEPVMREKRADGVTSYRIVAPVAAIPARTSRKRAARSETQAVAA